VGANKWPQQGARLLPSFPFAFLHLIFCDLLFSHLAKRVKRNDGAPMSWSQLRRRSAHSPSYSPPLGHFAERIKWKARNKNKKKSASSELLHWSLAPLVVFPYCARLKDAWLFVGADLFALTK